MELLWLILTLCPGQNQPSRCTHEWTPYDNRSPWWSRILITNSLFALGNTAINAVSLATVKLNVREIPEEMPLIQQQMKSQALRLQHVGRSHQDIYSGGKHTRYSPEHNPLVGRKAHRGHEPCSIVIGGFSLWSWLFYGTLGNE